MYGTIEKKRPQSTASLPAEETQNRNEQESDYNKKKFAAHSANAA